MTPNLEQKIKELPDIEFPSGLHGRIMRRVLFLRFRVNLSVILALLVCNAFLSGWYVLARIVETEIPVLISSLLQDFELSRSFIYDFINIVVPSFPIRAFLLFSANLFIMGYGIYVYLSAKKLAGVI